MNAYRTEPPTVEGQRIQVCQNKTAQIKLLAQYIGDGLSKNEAVIIIARPSLRKSVWSKLQALGFDMDFYKAQGQIKLYDAELLLSNILIDDVIDEHYFHTCIGKPIEAAQAAYGKVRAFGDMVDILWHRGLHDTALQLEKIRNELCQQHQLTVLCTYLRDSIESQSYRSTVEWMCKCSIHALSNHSYDSEEDGGTVLELFGTAWNSVINTFAQSKSSSRQLPSIPF